MNRNFCILLPAVILQVACGGGSGSSSSNTAPSQNPAPPLRPVELPPAMVDWDRILISTKLNVNVDIQEATAVIEIVGAESEGVSLEIGDLEILDVRAEVDDQVQSLKYLVDEGIHIGLPSSVSSSEITIHYRYQLHDDFNGAMGEGLTFTWPYFCGNLFPCKSDPSEGLSFELLLTGVPAEQQAVYPTAIIADAPSYMLAWAVGDYHYIDLGATAAGTQVGAWSLTSGLESATTGTSQLRDIFEWLEIAYGAYSFGLEVASVAAPWKNAAIGGMEHHPLWHVAAVDMDKPLAHAHEAAHGWFGNGIRIACWEDFVLSEGTATYLAARGIEQVAGVAAGQSVWDDYEARLEQLQSTMGNKVAWPVGCGAIDIIGGGLFSDAPYIKGAFFYRALEEKIGRGALDRALSLFYTRHVGQAARMQDVLDLIAVQTGYDPSVCATSWLRNDTAPDTRECL